MRCSGPGELPPPGGAGTFGAHPDLRIALRAAALLLLLITACGERDAALAAARAAVGPEVEHAQRFRIGEDEWIVALRRIGSDAPQLDPIAGGSVEPGAAELVLLHRDGDRWEPTAPGVFATGPEEAWGVDDVDGDGAADLWGALATGLRMDLRAYSIREPTLYRLIVPRDPGTGRPIQAQREFSFNVMDRERVQRWLSARADSIATALTRHR